MKIERFDNDNKEHSIDTDEMKDSAAMLYEKAEELRKLCIELKVPLMVAVMPEDDNVSTALILKHPTKTDDETMALLTSGIVNVIETSYPDYKVMLVKKNRNPI